MEPVLLYGLSTLIAVVIVILIVITVFFVKFLKELTTTVTKVNEIADIVKKEGEPALKSINNILSSVSNLSDATTKQLVFAKKVLSSVLGASFLAYSNLKSKGGFINGIISGFKFFHRKRR